MFALTVVIVAVSFFIATIAKLFKKRKPPKY